MNDIRVIARQLIIMVINDEDSIDDALKAWPSYANDQLLDEALHTLQHFQNDKDIRRIDNKYRQWQVNDLMKLIYELDKE